MNKIIVFLVCILVILCAIILGSIIYEKNITGQITEINETNEIQVSEKVTDECVDEYMQMQTQENAIDANSSDEIKLSPNCSLIIKTHYLDCDHTSNQYTILPEKLVNKTEEDFKKEYSDYNIEEFTANEVIISKNVDSECGEHYIVRTVDGNLTVFRLVNGIEELYEKTEISTEYMTETDKIQFENGLKVYGKENLSLLLEDFE